ncbi:MAG: M67 family metallopeptidase [Chloroflexi bacterium]|nr:MAG: M67 family metallopeptidase [Chloroflexota bacterium]TMC34823.1 MAG: M67 family metallopeptidase [Chloroflexota bacterium]TMC95261.1 MAG: M67 family metallopeptidase [Chloroflexota bacterium]TMD00903.1 MAG: M67 family metallopeptidase [Chloroflexota bacterium]
MVAGEAFIVRIPGNMYQKMVAHVAAAYPNEACGLLASKDGQVVKNYPTANVAEHPDDFSEIDPEVLLHISFDIDEYDGEMFSYYHSHPKSEAYPSPRDIEWAKRNKLYYIIFSHRLYPETPYARVFSVQDDGTVIEGKIEVL